MLKRVGRWWNKSKRSKRNEIVAKKAVIRWQSKRMGLLWACWCEQHANLARLKRQARKVATRWQNKGYATAFATWQECTKVQRKLRESATKVVKRWRNRTQALAWIKWCTLLEQRRIRLTASKVCLRWRNRALAAAWIGWYDMHVALVRVAKLNDRVVRRWLHAEMSFAMDTWISAMPWGQEGDQQMGETRKSDATAFRCEYDCGFTGGFEQVSAHEFSCKFNPSPTKRMFLPFFNDWQASDAGRLEISHVVDVPSPVDGGQRRDVETETASPCNAMLAEVREKHLFKKTKALTNKSTIGIVLDGTRVLMVVPGSPSYFPNENGERIEVGDTIYAIDGEQVTEADIVSKMIGTDDTGSTVVLTVLKKSPGASAGSAAAPLGEAVKSHNKEPIAINLENTYDEFAVLSPPKVEFKLVRADMKSTIDVKDLYLSMRFLNTEIEKLGQPADLKQEFDVLVMRVQAVMALNAEHQEHLQAHVCDLEASVRALYAKEGRDSWQRASTSSDFTGYREAKLALCAAEEEPLKSTERIINHHEHPTPSICWSRRKSEEYVRISTSPLDQGDLGKSRATTVVGDRLTPVEARIEGGQRARQLACKLPVIKLNFAENSKVEKRADVRPTGHSRNAKVLEMSTGMTEEEAKQSVNAIAHEVKSSVSERIGLGKWKEMTWVQRLEAINAAAREVHPSTSLPSSPFEKDTGGFEKRRMASGVEAWVPKGKSFAKEVRDTALDVTGYSEATRKAQLALRAAEEELLKSTDNSINR